MRGIRSPLVGAALALLAGCGSVSVPSTRYWRLALPPAAGIALPAGGVLRVQELQLGQALSGDCLLVGDGGVQLWPRELDRWIAPLDRLVTDAVALGLARTRAFALVKGGGDGGGEDLTLHGRIVDFTEVQPRQVARVALELWVERAGAVVVHDEFAAETALGDSGPAAPVHALSASLADVLGQLLARLHATGGLPGDPAARPPG